MNPKPATVPATIALQHLVDAYFLPAGLRFALVCQCKRYQAFHQVDAYCTSLRIAPLRSASFRSALVKLTLLRLAPQKLARPSRAPLKLASIKMAPLSLAPNRLTTPRSAPVRS